MTATRLLTALVLGFLLALWPGTAPVYAQVVPPPELPTAPRDPSRPITVGVPNDTYPYSFVDPSGRVQGFAVDLLAAVEATMGLRLERVTGSTTEINGAFERGDLDMIQTYAESPSREAHADFSVPYLTASGSIFVRKDVTGVSRLEDLRGRRVLVHKGSLGEQILRDADLGDTVVYADSVNDGFTRLAAGEGDATLATRLTGLMVVHQQGIDNVVPVGEPVPGYQVRYCFAVRDGDRQLLARLNEGLAIIERTGVGGDIYHKWFGPVEPRRYSPFAIALAVAVGLAVALVVAVWSIMRQRVMAERLRQQEARMHRAQKLEAIGTLSSGIAHDFNNILTTIIGNAELLKADLPPASVMADCASDILQAAERARQLVAQVLTFSRQRDPRRTVTAIMPVVDEAIRFLRATTPSTIAITVTKADESLMAEVDATQLHQALMNVGTNAVYAMRDGQGRLDVAVQAVTLDAEAASQVHVEPGRYVCITLRDTGRGIPADVLPRVFDPFFTTKPHGEGTGLGLAVVLAIMHAHQGGVTVTSAVGVGTEVRLYLPVSDAPPSGVVSDEPLPEGGGRSVLLLDDEPGIARSVSLMLERLGYRVNAFTDAAEALEVFEVAPEKIDLVLTDLAMPEASGLDVARRVRAIRPDVPVVMMSGYMSEAERQRAQGSGVTAIVDKPPTAAVLAHALDRCLRAHQPHGRAAGDLTG